MSTHWWQRHRAERSPNSDLGAETEAFLSGQLAAWLDHHDRRVPSWAWVNSVSRAGLDDLVASDRLRWRSRRNRRWADTFLSPLAADLALRCRGDDAALADLQRRFLWPLESRLARGQGPDVSDPNQLSSLVRTALGWGASRVPSVSGVYPPPPIGRNIGHGRINRIALTFLGPASVARRPPRPEQPAG